MREVKSGSLRFCVSCARAVDALLIFSAPTRLCFMGGTALLCIWTTSQAGSNADNQPISSHFAYSLLDPKVGFFKFAEKLLADRGQWLAIS